MTENEAIKEMKYYSEEEYGKGLVAESHSIAIKALEEVQQYRAIGTVEEFKTLKEQEETFARNVNMVGNLQSIAMKEGYDKAVDEFARRMKELYPTDGHINATIHRAIEGVAEQMKAGGENE